MPSVRQLLYLVLLLCLPAAKVLGQVQAGTWYFGRNAGIKFTGNSVTALSNGQLITLEGCATQCDVQGNLLFYTDGLRVFDRNHSVMPNGSGLAGNPSSTQAAISVPLPGSADQYYIFTTTDAGKPDGFRYSMVDMKANGGLGDLSIKNVPVHTPCAEKLAAVAHANGRDIWIVVHEAGSNRFLAYLLTPAGLQRTPVISAIGSIHGSGLELIGQLSFSPDGKKVASVPESLHRVDLFNFDDASGKISNPILLSIPQFKNTYGTAFSPDSRYLYVTVTDQGRGSLIQYRVDGNDPIKINSTRTDLPADQFILGSIQAGPDGRLYVSRFLSDSLGVINFPDSPGISCQYKPNGIFLGNNRQCVLGLPAYPAHYFNRPQFTYKGSCLGDSTFFNIGGFERLDSVSWQFRDPDNNIFSHSNLYNPQLQFASPGDYLVKLKTWSNGKVDSAFRQITIADVPKVSLGKDTFLCPGDSLELDAGTDAAYYTWSDNSSRRKIRVGKPGTYWITAGKGGCYTTDTIKILPSGAKFLRMPDDTVLCKGSIWNLNLYLPATTYRWQDGTTHPFHIVATPGKYWVEMKNRCGTFSDTVRVQFTQPPVVNLGRDTILCPGELLRLRATNKNATYQWQDGSTDSIYWVSSPGIYIVTVKNACSKVTGRVTVAYAEPPVINLGPDSLVICQGDSVNLNAFWPLSNIRWENGSRVPVRTIKETGKYGATLSNRCGTATDSIRVGVEDCTCYLYAPNAFTPDNDGINDVFLPAACRNREYQLCIYNRWGQQIFESRDENFGWDGTLGNVSSPIGIYLYAVHVRGMDGRLYDKRGTVLLIR